MNDISTLNHSNSNISRLAKVRPDRLFGQSASAQAVNSRDEPAEREFTIAEMARAVGVSLRTLRFYEARGLLRPRREGAARHYGGVDRRRLDMILTGKRLGFTLGEIFDLIGAQTLDGLIEFEERLQPQQIANQICHLERRRGEIEAAIERLRATRKKLERIGIAGEAVRTGVRRESDDRMEIDHRAGDADRAQSPIASSRSAGLQ